MAGISAFLSRTPHIKMPRVRGTSLFESKSGRYGDCAYSKWPAGAEALFKKWRAPEHELQAVIFTMAALQVGRSKLQPMNGKIRAALIQGDAQRLPFASDSFDMVVSCETIEHVPDADAAMREMWRVARTGARLFLTTPNYANLMGLYDLYSRVRHPHQQDDQPFDRRQWIPQIRGFVRDAGWKIVRSDGTVHQLPIFPGRNPVALPSLESNRLLRRLLSPFAYHYFLVAEKREPA